MTDTLSPSPEAAQCLHETFKAQVGVGRLSERDGGPITHYTAEVRVWCAQCGRPFQFLGLPMGSTPYGATTSVDALECRLAIKPEDGAGPPPGLPELRVKPSFGAKQ